jgi:uncharacterized protein
VNFETPQIISLQSIKPVPWKNGGGVTRELLIQPYAAASAGSNAAPWAYRISVATIDRDGPFSVFSQIERWFTVIKGEPLQLTIDGVMRLVSITDPAFMFKGDVTIDCRLTRGPTQDLNLMVHHSISQAGHAGFMAQVSAGIPWLPRVQLNHLDGDVKAGLYSDVAGVLRWRSVKSSILSELSVKSEELIWFDFAPRELWFEPAAAQTISGWWMSVQ